MIHDLLDASVVRAGERLPLQIEEYDMTLLVKDVAEEFNIIYGNRIEVQAKKELFGFWSKSGVRRVIENLATNAAKYGTPHTPITISLEQAGTKAILSVHNEGNPIPPHDQSILFQQFRRAKSAQVQTGWGLGLTVVKGLTEAHLGTVRVESEEGAGTRFTVELPVDSREISH